MATINDGGPAFPHEADYIRGDGPGDDWLWKEEFHPGMTLRDWLAGQALAGDLASQSPDTGELANEVTNDVLFARSRMLYRFADAMIAARGAS